MSANKTSQPLAHLPARFDSESAAYDVPRTISMMSKQIGDPGSEGLCLARAGRCENL